jgi:hypothetical protein
MRTVHITQDLDRDKVLDAAIFLAICGLNQMRDGSITTGLARVEEAIYMMQKVVSRRDDIIKEYLKEDEEK